jgi:lysophospholipase L1-like esterase
MLAWLRILIVNLAVFGLLFALVEGTLSVVLFVRSAESNIRRATFEWSYTTYDAELGWVSAPNVFVADMYGPGRYLRTNDRGFRNDHKIEDTSASGPRRVVCSGDSFTYGYGVGNDQTWCARLAAITPCLETVNLGQGGYGVDQSYLRYKRDARSLQHDLHLLAFITGDFTRMQGDNLFGYGKPVLKLEEGALRIANVPVPRRPFYVKWLTAIASDLRDLRMFAMLERVRKKLSSDPTHRRAASGHAMPGEMGQVLKKVFEETKRLADQQGSKLILVYLPSPDEYAPGETSRAWSDFLQREAEALGIAFIDLVARHRHLSASEAATLFSEEYRHLSVKGNEYVARAIYRDLMRFPETAALALDTGGRCVRAS